MARFAHALCKQEEWRGKKAKKLRENESSSSFCRHCPVTALYYRSNVVGDTVGRQYSMAQWGVFMSLDTPGSSLEYMHTTFVSQVIVPGAMIKRHLQIKAIAESFYK